MSGGSYEYLCNALDERILDPWTIKRLEQMRDDMIIQGLDDGAAMLQEFILTIKLAKVKLDSMGKRYYDLIHAMEWWVSCDIGRDSVVEEINKLAGLEELNE